MNINFILSIEATFVKITFQSRKQEDLNDFSALLLLPLFEWPQPAFVSSFVWINSE